MLSRKEILIIKTGNGYYFIVDGKIIKDEKVKYHVVLLALFHNIVSIPLAPNLMFC